MGSSTVTMCRRLFSLMTLRMLASVVDLPEPVGPVTRISPRGMWIKLVHRRGQPDFIHFEDTPRNEPCHDADGPFLQEHADAEPRVLAERQREIDPAALVQRFDVLILGDAAREFLGVGGGHHRQSQLDDLAVQTQRRRAARADVQIRTALVECQTQQVFDGGHEK